MTALILGAVLVLAILVASFVSGLSASYISLRTSATQAAYQIETLEAGANAATAAPAATATAADANVSAARATAAAIAVQILPTPSPCPLGSICFSSLPDGTPITADRILEGDEFLVKGIRLAGAPESSYCADATRAAIRRPGTYVGVTFYFLTTASSGDINRCNSIPVAINFISPVRRVTLTFAGASTTYTLKAYDAQGTLLNVVKKDAVFGGGTFDITFSSENSDISRVTFGEQTAITAIKEISYTP